MSTKKSLAEILKEKQQNRHKDLAKINEVAQARAKLEKEKKEKEDAKLKARLEKRQRELEAKRLREEAEQKRLIELKTKVYFEIDKYNRKKPPEGYPKYFGDHIGTHGAWMPHGSGELHYNTEKIFEGKFEHGVMHGAGTFTFENGSKWEGEFKAGEMHGVGVIVKEDGSRHEALMRYNKLLCYKEELQNGKQVDIHDHRMLLGNRQPRVTILYNMSKWRYACRFHDETNPRERQLPSDADQKYNYWSDVYGSERPKLGFAGGRNTGDMKALAASPLKTSLRATTDYTENVFESRAIGVGAAIEEDEEKRLQEKKRKQWNEVLERRRQEEAAQRQKLVEEEQKRRLEEATAARQQKLQQRQAEEAALKESLEKEAEKWTLAQQEIEQTRQMRSQSVSHSRPNTAEPPPL